MTNQDKFLAVYKMAQIWPPSTGGDVYRIVRFVGDTDYITGESIEATWQNAAESLPAAPEKKVVYDAWGKAGRLQPVAPVEAKEKKQCATCGKFYEWINANSECERCEAKSCTNPDCEICEQIFTEPKPTPSTPLELDDLCIHCNRRVYMYKQFLVHVHSTSSWCDGEETKAELPQPDSSFIDKVRDLASAISKREPISSPSWSDACDIYDLCGSSSISTEPHKSVTELACEHENLAEYLKQVETELHDTKRALEMACASDTWNPNVYLDSAHSERLAAKGQNNTDRVQRLALVEDRNCDKRHYMSDEVDAFIDSLETELRDVVFICECDKCAFIANPEHVGQRCRLCGGSVKRIATSVEAERGAVIASNRINQLCSEAKDIKVLHAGIIEQGRKVQIAASGESKYGAMSAGEYIEWMLGKLEGK